MGDDLKLLKDVPFFVSVVNLEERRVSWQN